MSDAWILVWPILFVLTLAVCVVLSGLGKVKGEDAFPVCAMAALLPLTLPVAVLVGPWVGLYVLMRWISRRAKRAPRVVGAPSPAECCKRSFREGYEHAKRGGEYR